MKKYSADPSASARTFGPSLAARDSLLLADDGDALVGVADSLAANGADLKRLQLLGTRPVGQSARVRQRQPARRTLRCAGPVGFPGVFSSRYRAKYGGDPVRTATLAYDGVALVAALARTQGGQRFSPDVPHQSIGLRGHRRVVSFPQRRHQ